VYDVTDVDHVRHTFVVAHLEARRRIHVAGMTHQHIAHSLFNANSPTERGE
jgi:hypothetical protein